MVSILPYPSQAAEARLQQIAGRRMGADPKLEQQVLEILESVRREGDRAVLRLTRQFDAPTLGEDQFTVSREEIQAAYEQIDATFLDLLRTARGNIEAFHRQQLHPAHFVTKPDGTFLGQLVRPVAAAGLYIPGGKGGETPLISSVLMNGIPARLAGVADLALATPPRADGTINPHLLVAAQEVGVTRIHKMGSAWAIGALAYGTDRVTPVDVIVGPGNIYVALAKKLIAGLVGIDLLAGPSEILVVADAKARAEYVAADLLSQAEHDVMASAVLITTDPQLADRTLHSLQQQNLRLPRREIAQQALQNYGAIFQVADLDSAIDLANRIAPEHLELQIQDPWQYLGKIQHAGAVFLGEHTPEAIGDYFAGPNHVLPTAGTARFASALGVDNFLKRTSVIAYSAQALQRDAEAVMQLARLEGLEAHAASIGVRVTSTKKK